MQKTSLFTVLILIILVFSLFVNILIFNKLSRITGELQSKDTEPASVELDSISGSEAQSIPLKIDTALDGIKYPQEQKISLMKNPDLDRIRYLQQQIIDREVIRDDCLIGLPIDDQLKADIREYNELVSSLKGFFAKQAVHVLITLFELDLGEYAVDEDGSYFWLYTADYLNIPPDVREYVEIIADLSLYRNCTELLCGDPRLAFFIYNEGGGSGGMWPYFWHTEYLRGYEDKREDLDRLFNLVEGIIASLDRVYENSYYVRQ
ncbi:MAG TPA: hypothetical protein PK369_07765 [Thermoclostridium sp.]|nr:hypothetical protein [Clostridiaceae bacterium]HOQ76445.1 hypothetical protein [Thermoclostridium sp.]HPU44905.1 hypothetical protein [Thermoclostridium sp.]